jgi:hypothetical protein
VVLAYQYLCPCQLAEYQAHDGAVDVQSAPAVQYHYDDGAGGKDMGKRNVTVLQART